MLSREIIAQLTVEDMPNEQVQRLVQICGMEATLKILSSFAGQTIYLPKYWTTNCLPKLVQLMLAAGADKKQICKTLDIAQTTYYLALNQKTTFRMPVEKDKKGPEQLDFFKGGSK